jgi:hypothetical protein
MVSPRRGAVRVAPHHGSDNSLLPRAGGLLRGFGSPGEARATRRHLAQLLRSAEELPEDGVDDAATATGRPQTFCDVSRDAGVLPGRGIFHRHLRLLVSSAFTR